MASSKPRTLADVFKSHDTHGATRTPHKPVADHLAAQLKATKAVSHADAAQLIGRECLIEYHGAPINGVCVDIQTPYNQITFHIEITYDHLTSVSERKVGTYIIKIRDGVQFWGGK
jgi:hypothetical protein